MSRKLVILKLLAITLCLTLSGQAAAQTVGVGVSSGNVFKYNVKYFWSSTNASATPPASWVEANSTEYFQATIKEVISTTITLQTVQHFPNGTDNSKDELVDVATSLGGSLLVYASNLVAGSYLYPSSTNLPLIINATVSRPYGSGYRDTNWIQVRMTNAEDFVYRFTSIYFDKATGVLVDAYFEDSPSNLPNQNFSRTIKITESSLWTVPGTPSDGDGNGGGDNQTTGLPMELVYGVVVAVVIVAVVATVFVLRKRGRKVKL